MNRKNSMKDVLLSGSSPQLRIPVIIERKARGNELTKQEITYFIKELCSGRVQDSQLGAFLMAVYCREMTEDEITTLTDCMIHSGKILSWPEEWKSRGIHLVDKHSTGGIGDKVSLPLVPALAACGVKVPMISGRGLAHTGGTLDKLESIPGMNVCLNIDDFQQIVADIGCCIIGQAEDLVYADKIMYATRDVTGTVSSNSLIAGSIVSKKAVESLEVLVLDVKTGHAAVIPEVEEAAKLAALMVDIGNNLGVKTIAMLTEMSNPLGMKAGHSLEIEETIDCLKGSGPEDLLELVTEQGGHLLYNVGQANSIKNGKDMITEVLNNGKALAKFVEMIRAQGVNEEDANTLIREPRRVLPIAKYRIHFKTETEGYIEEINALTCGLVLCWLGAGREHAGSEINHGIGLHFHKKKGDSVEKGDTWLTVYYDDSELSEKLNNLLHSAIIINPDPVKRTSRVIKVIQ